jgi:type IV secretory pathway TrbL component
MTENTTDSVQVLAGVLTAAAAPHDGLHAELVNHAPEVAETVIAGIRANTDQGAQLRAALGIELTYTTRVGKNVKAAMDAFSNEG